MNQWFNKINKSDNHSNNFNKDRSKFYRININKGDNQTVII